MALMAKKANLEPVEYVPEKERGDEKPTKFWIVPMKKGEWDSYQDNIKSKMKGGSFQTETKKAKVRMFQTHIKKIENIYIDGEFHETVDDQGLIGYFMSNMTDVESANEIENVIQGISTLDEDEAKNSELELEQSGSTQ